MDRYRLGSRLIVAVLILLLASCHNIRISGVEKAPDFSISRYKTFGFFETQVGGPGLATDFGPNLELLKNEIATQLDLKGLTRSQRSPDLILNIGVVVEVKDQTRETNIGDPGDRQMSYMGGRNYGWESKEVFVRQYREGSVTVDLVDQNTFKLVWTGTAESVLPSHDKNVPATIEAAMKELFSKM